MVLTQSDLNMDGNPEICEMVVHIFGGKDSLCCSNYILKRTGRDNFGSFEASRIKTVLKLFYMDHFL